MQNDSIRENISKEDVVTAIQLEIDADPERNVAIVLVEGQDDVAFIKKIFSDEVICYESFSGKQGLEELLEHEDLQHDEIIAIRDKDYMDISLVPYRMFLYDGCCLETMLLQSEEVVSSFYQFYYGGSRTKDEYIVSAMRELAPYSILRMQNEKNKGEIRFQKVGFGDLVSASGELDIKKLFSRLKVNNDELEYCKQLADSVKSEDLKEITNGHDLCLLLGVMAKKGMKKLGEDGVRRLLLCNYRRIDFRETKLYRSLKEYEGVHHVKFVDE